MTRRLLSEDVGDEGGAREAWSADRIAGTHREFVAAVALVVPARCDEFVSRVEMQAQALDRLRHDAFGFDTEAMCLNAGRRVETELHRERWQFQRLLVEVIERAEPQIAGLRPVVDLAGVGGEGGADADLKVRQRAV